MIAPTRIYGRLVASREDRILEHIDKHRLDVTPEEYVAIGDKLLSEHLITGGGNRDMYILSNGRYLAVMKGILPSGHLVLRSVRMANVKDFEKYSSVVQSLTYSA